MSSRRSELVAGAIAVGAAVLLAPAVAHAYVGPGAGIAFATTAFALIVSIFLTVIGLLLYPLRLLWRLARRRPLAHTPRIRRAVIVGLDGLDPALCRRYLDEGKLPNLARLAELGCFQPLATTYPAMSPVAWSSFATGVHPAKHGIFDFLTRDPRTYMPDISSAEIRPPRRTLRIGPYEIPLGRPDVQLLRKSRAFWEELGRHGVPCSVLRVPITFPPERFEGTMLSAMCVPDLEGTQGTFTYFSTAGDIGRAESGRRVAIEIDSDRRVVTWIDGPPNPIRRDRQVVRLRLKIDVDRAAGHAIARIGRQRVVLRVGEDTDWIPVAFPLGFGLSMRGICRFRLLELEPELRLYLSPINIDPESPVVPISHPRLFATFLSKLLGRYATLGLAEDTWALNEGVLDEDGFLEQAWANHREREAMFFAMLRRNRRGVVACVFDGTDRIQHMFMRYLHDDHPARAADPADGERAARYATVIEDTYRRMDDLVGRVFRSVDPEDPRNLVMVMSDHGFQVFRRGININAWLLANGYLHLEEGRAASGEWFDGVDWSRTRAYALGLGGVFLNVAGREAKGCVAPEAAAALADELAERLGAVVDPVTGELAIRNAYASHRLYRGPYSDRAPDLIVGYAAGWRISWDGARGIANDVVFEDNVKAWSGDHCIDPELVPGVVFSNRNLRAREASPHIVDIAPTLLDLFGVAVPRYMDGVSLSRDGDGA